MASGNANVWQPSTVTAISANTKSVSQRYIATANQVRFVTTNFTYVIQTGALEVHKNGALLDIGIDFVEVDGNNFSLTNPANLNDIISATAHVGITGQVPIITVARRVDIRDFGGIKNDPTFDNSTALLNAILVAEGADTDVYISGGKYYFNNLTLANECSLIGGGSIAPIAAALDTLPLFDLTASNSKISSLLFDSESSGIYPLRISGDDNNINHIIGLNLIATATTSTSAACVHVTGDRNIVESIGTKDYTNGNNSNPSIPRVLTNDSGASNNNYSNIIGLNVAAGLVHGGGSNNTLDGFTFDNSAIGDSEQRNGVYTLSDNCINLVVKNGTINKCSQPIVDKALNSHYSDIVEIDSNADGVAFPCKGVIFDAITKRFTGLPTITGGFIRTRAENDGLAVDGLTVINCVIDMPNFYVSIFTFDQGAVDNLKVINNVFVHRHIDDNILFKNIIIHSEGENPKYKGNSFVVKNEATAFTTDQFFFINLPSNATKGAWIDNDIVAQDTKTFIRVSNVLNKPNLRVDDDNIVRADFGTPYIQSGRKAKLLSSIAPPNSGAWNAGDILQNLDIDTTPAAGFDFKKFLYWACITTGEYGTGTEPVFVKAVDMAAATVIGQITAPAITSPIEGAQIAAPNASLTSSAFSATGGITHASTDWEVADDIGFTNILFSSLADAVNKVAITATGLPVATTVFIRVGYIGNGSEESGFGLVRTALTSSSPTADTLVGQPASFTTTLIDAATQLFEVYASDTKDLILLGGQAGKLFKGSNAVNPITIASPVNSSFSVHGLDGADDSSTVFISGASSVHHSGNNGASWVTSTGFDFFTLTDIEVRLSCDSTGAVVLAVFGNRSLDSDAVLNDIYISSNFGVSFTRKTAINILVGNIIMSKVARTSSAKMYVITKGTELIGGQVYLSSNSGTTWAAATTQPSLIIGQKIFCIDCTPNGQTCFIGCSAGRMFKSTDFGVTWSEINIGLAIDPIRSCSVSRDSQMVAFGVGNGDYIRSFDAGVNFALSTGLAGSTLRSAAVNSADDLMVIGTRDGNMLKSNI